MSIVFDTLWRGDDNENEICMALITYRKAGNMIDVQNRSASK